ncbi:MAG: tetraacyldisaccharide 4'-kinase [Saprospiraceae bacterium]|nr:tetraacyldisaccharide 4'-kinase [Saprospiraceae bacterium]
MIQRILVRILLSPFALLYGIGVSVRNLFYREGLLKSIEFNVPVISVGNLSVGGAGKTPHIEYLIRLLSDYLEVATLSRGYKRKTKGFLTVQPGMTANQVGDEPLQYKRKFPEVTVTVSESRAFAIPEIMMEQPDTQVILLDDAFQHRSVRPGLNILLTEYDRPFTRDYLLPSGRLREWRSSYRRADILVVSKCPPEMEKSEREKLIEEIDPRPHQRLYFSYYQYHHPYYIWDSRYRAQLTEEVDLLLICAIARTDYLLSYLEKRAGSIRVLEYEDHHEFSKYDIGNLKSSFDKLESNNKLILTTEKDAMRLDLHRAFLQKHQLPIFALPVQVKFHFDGGEAFDEDVKQFLLNFKV